MSISVYYVGFGLFCQCFFAVWVPPPPMEISRSKDYVHVALAEDYPFAFRDWQLCVCMEDDSHSEVRVFPYCKATLQFGSNFFLN